LKAATGTFVVPALMKGPLPPKPPIFAVTVPALTGISVYAGPPKLHSPLRLESAAEHARTQTYRSLEEKVISFIVPVMLEYVYVGGVAAIGGDEDLVAP
jgi:hypothetical protein